MTTRHPDELWRLATAQWAEIHSKLPDLAMAVGLQQRLLRLMIDATARLDPALPETLTPAAIAEKLGRGIPALRNEVVSIPAGLKEILPPVCTALAEGGAGQSALHIRDAITSEGIDADSLLRVSLARDQKALRSSALHMGFSPDLLWMIGELGSAPLAHCLGAGCAEKGVWRVFRPRPAENPPDPFFVWDGGYCPFCGSWPAFIEAIDGVHELRCSYCALGWQLSSHRCLYCGNSGENFVSAAPDVSIPDRRVELCGQCGAYTKVLAVREPAPFPLLAVADLATMELDQGAMERGYRRPDLYDLDALEPRTSRC